MSSIEELLTEKGIEFIPNPNNPSELTVRCFSGLHEDKNPSLSINLDKGVYNCFSCGFKGNIHQFFSGLGISKVPETVSKLGVRLKKLRIKLDSIKSDIEIHLPEPRINMQHEFKNISGDTLKQFGAFFTDSSGFSDYLCIPIYQHKKLRFVEGRYRVLNSEEPKPKYLRKPARVSVADILFPLDAITDFSYIILVEGLFDVLKMHELGYTNCLCIFGTQNFTAEKAKLLDEYGCRHVTILMDGDSPGRLAAIKIQRLLDARYIETDIVSLPEGLDPGAFDEEAADYYLDNI